MASAEHTRDTAIETKTAHSPPPSDALSPADALPPPDLAPSDALPASDIVPGDPWAETVQKFLVEALAHSQGDFPMVWLQAFLRRLAQRDQELSEREKALEDREQRLVNGRERWLNQRIQARQAARAKRRLRPG